MESAVQQFYTKTVLCDLRCSQTDMEFPEQLGLSSAFVGQSKDSLSSEDTIYTS